MKRVKYIGLTVFLCSLFLMQPVGSMGQEKNLLRGGELVMALNNAPAHFNPALNSGTLTGLVGSQIFAGLIRCDAQGNPEPYLAKSWQFSEDGLSLRVSLRDNAFFHDGSPIRAEDVIFSLQTAQTYHPFSTMLSALEKMEAVDERTVILYLKHYHPALLQVLTTTLTPILPKHVYGDGHDIPTHPANWQTVGSGPFTLVDYQAGKIIRLQAFKKFFLEGRPYLDSIVFRIFSDPGEIPMALENGDVHLTGFSPLSIHHNQLAKRENLTVSTEGFDGIGPMIWLGFNLKQKPFNDIRVRRSFAFAIDRDFVVKTIFGAQAEALDGPIVPSSPFYSPPSASVKVDIVKANRLLDEAGYKRDAGGKRMTIDITTPPDIASLSVPFLTYLRHHLSRSIGVDLRIHVYSEFAAWAQKITTGNFQITLDVVFTWYDPVIGIHRVYDSTVHRTYDSNNIRPGVTWSNTPVYANSEVDALLDAASKEKSIVRRQGLYAKFQDIVRKDQPMVWLGTIPYASIYDNRLRGLNTSLWGLLGPMDMVFWSE